MLLNVIYIISIPIFINILFLVRTKCKKCYVNNLQFDNKEKIN